MEIKKKANQIIESITAWLQKLKFNIENKIEESIYDDLTPLDDLEHDEYQKALEWALGNKKIKNIALTGSYGSGKSSILRTFEKNNQESFNFLNISLATFSKDDNKIDSRLVERSVLQQIFYSQKPEDIPESRFKRLFKVSFWKTFRYSSLLLVWLFSLEKLLFPQFINDNLLLSTLQSIINSFFETDFNFSNYINVLYLINTTIFFFGLGVLLYLLVKFIRRFNISKLNFAKGEIEISKNIDSSILNKHLDEIVYFFEVSKTNVVIIEDIDRLIEENCIDLLTKLRELNYLLNKSKQLSKKPVVFIYAIKDDLFEKDSSRTKFFDFIIPVIPVVDYRNSRDELYNSLEKRQLVSEGISDKKISKQLIFGVSIFIQEKRVIINILNEFFIYENRLKDEIPNKEKLFSIIVYKNLHPKDFALVYRQKSVLDEVFKTKKIYVNREKGKFGQKIFKAREQIKNDIEGQLGQTEIQDLINSINKYKKKIRDIESLRLIDIINVDRIFVDNFKNILIGKPSLTFMLKNNFIDETYSYFTSYFKSGYLSKKDIHFYHSANDSDSLPFDYDLNEVKNLVETLPKGTFKRNVILNNDVVSFLLRNHNSFENELQSVFEIFSLENEQSVEFIEQFINEKPDAKNEFVKYLTRFCDEYWLIVEQGLNGDETQKYFELLIENYDSQKALERINSKSDGCLKVYIEGRDDLVTLYEGSNLSYELSNALEILKPKFKKLDYSGQESRLLNSIYSENLYELNSKMIALLCNNFDLESIIDEKYVNYSLVKELDFEELTEYVDENIEEFVKRVLLVKDVLNEDETYFVRLLNTDDGHLSIETKKLLIEKQEVTIDNIENVESKDLWADLFKYSTATPIWRNVFPYYKFINGIDDNLVTFLDVYENVKSLSDKRVDKVKSEHSDCSRDISDAIVYNQDIEAKSYKKLLESIPYKYGDNYLDFDEILDDRLLLLLENRHQNIETCPFNYHEIKKKSGSLHIKLLEQDFIDFLEHYNEYEIDSDDLYEIILSDKIDNVYKTELLEKIDHDIVDYTLNKEQANEIINHLLENPSFDLNENTFEHLIKSPISIKKKLQFIESLVGEIDDDIICRLFRKLPSPYHKITQKKKRPKIEKTDTSYDLAQKLLEHNLIEDFEEIGNNLRIKSYWF